MNVVQMTACAAALAALSMSGAQAAPALATNNVNLRQGPGTNYPIITTIPGGSTVELSGCSGQWCTVVWQGQSGYSIATSFEQGGNLPPPGAAPPAGSPPPQGASPPAGPPAGSMPPEGATAGGPPPPGPPPPGYPPPGYPPPPGYYPPPPGYYYPPPYGPYYPYGYYYGPYWHRRWW